MNPGLRSVSAVNMVNVDIRAYVDHPSDLVHIDGTINVVEPGREKSP